MYRYISNIDDDDDVCGHIVEMYVCVTPWRVNISDGDDDTDVSRSLDVFFFSFYFFVLMGSRGEEDI